MFSEMRGINYMKEIRINKEQAQTIAFSIFTDIEKYITEHQEEFEAYLQTEMA